MRKNRWIHIIPVLFSAVLVSVPFAMAGVGTPPTVVSISPADMATNVSPTANLIVTFDELVSLALDDMQPLEDNSIIINCTLSGIQSYPPANLGGITIANIDFNDFTIGDVCTVTLSAFWIHDQDDGNHFDGDGDGVFDPEGDDFVSTFTVGTGGAGSGLIFTNGFE